MINHKGEKTIKKAQNSNFFFQQKKVEFEKRATDNLKILNVLYAYYERNINLLSQMKMFNGFLR